MSDFGYQERGVKSIREIEIAFRFEHQCPQYMILWIISNSNKYTVYFNFVSSCD